MNLIFQIIQKRMGDSTSFHRDWNDYKNGFGSPNDSYWLGMSSTNISNFLSKNIKCHFKKLNKDIKLFGRGISVV